LNLVAWDRTLVHPTQEIKDARDKCNPKRVKDGIPENINKRKVKLIQIIEFTKNIYD
jgi:hypothetical protein